MRCIEELAEELPEQLDRTAGMQYWSERELPFYYGLARTFPLATRWFSSCLGPTFPNRRFLISGTAHGLINDLPFGMIDYPESGTIFDHLDAHGISWINYIPGPWLRAYIKLSGTYNTTTGSWTSSRTGTEAPRSLRHRRFRPSPRESPSPRHCADQPDVEPRQRFAQQHHLERGDQLAQRRNGKSLHREQPGEFYRHRGWGRRDRRQPESRPGYLHQHDRQQLHLHGRAPSPALPT